MGDVVSLHPGNGAKETLDRYFDTDAYGAYIAAGALGSAAAASNGGWLGLNATDHLLAWLWAEGFVVKPLEDK